MAGTFGLHPFDEDEALRNLLLPRKLTDSVRQFNQPEPKVYGPEHDHILSSAGPLPQRPRPFEAPANPDIQKPASPQVPQLQASVNEPESKAPTFGDEVFSRNPLPDPGREAILKTAAPIAPPQRPTAEYHDPHMGTGRLIAGMIMSMLKPTQGVGSYLLNQPYQKAETDYSNALKKQSDFDTTMQQGRQSRQEQLDRDLFQLKAQEANKPDKETVTTATGIKQRSKTGLYDIKVGDAPTKEAPLSDFESAFQREHHRLPTATELEAHKAKLAREGRAQINTGDGFKVLSAEEIKAAGFPEGTVAQRNGKTGKIEVVSKASEAQKSDDRASGKSAVARDMDNAIATVDRLGKHPALSASVGAKGASSFFGLKEKPVAGSKAAGFVADLDVLKSQLFLQSIQKMRGFGALSNMEGMKVESAIEALNRDMDEGQFRGSLQRLRSYLENMRAAVQKESGGASAASAGSAAPSGGGKNPAPEGTIIEVNGQRKIKRGGAWVDHQ